MRAGIVSSWNEPCLLLDPISHLLSKRQPNKKVDCIPVGAEIVISIFEGKTGPSRIANLRREVENTRPVFNVYMGSTSPITNARPG